MNFVGVGVLLANFGLCFELAVLDWSGCFRQGDVAASHCK